MENGLTLWNKVSRVPPEHLKSFSRAGGFTGTAIKPMWSIETMTEHFGQIGVGWGTGEPSYQIVPVHETNEILVYCTLSVWAGDRANVFYGVGGDKVLALFKSGPKADDEAFKKAFTDALTNALKHLGVGASVHMGLWDGNKYADDPHQKPEGKSLNITYRDMREEHPPVAPTAAQAAFHDKVYEGFSDILERGTEEDLKSWLNKNKAEIDVLPEELKASLRNRYTEVNMKLKNPKVRAA